MLRHAPRVTDLAVAVGKRIRVRLAGEVVGGGVVDFHDAVPLLVHVPHADVPLESVAGVVRRIDERATVAHRELRPVVHFGQSHPDERHAVRVPRVDFVRDDVPLLIHERNVLAAGMVEVVVAEAVGVLLADIDQHREVRERLGARVARHGERQIALELVRHPVGVRAVVVVVRLGRNVVHRRERAGNRRRFLVVISDTLELVEVGGAVKYGDSLAARVVGDKVLCKRRPFGWFRLAVNPELVHDATGRRVAKVVDGTAGNDVAVRNALNARKLGSCGPRDRKFVPCRELT